MFGNRFFGPRFYGDRYFGEGGAGAPVTPTAVRPNLVIGMGPMGKTRNHPHPSFAKTGTAA